MKDYILRSVDCFILPREVYYQCVWLIKDMDRLEEIKRDAGKTRLGLAASRRLEAVEKALQELPEEYREPMLRNIKNKEEFPMMAHANTWRKWKQRFIYDVAINLELL